MTTNRIDMLTQFLGENPGDAFARYGLAMEYAKAGELETALQEFKKLLELHPDYTAGYFMAAQTLAKAGRTSESRTYLEKGIGAAARSGNAHAKGEMEAMLAELGEQA
jgi:tetratricopeptide (TPR) repeat protein